ncbi:MAG: D-arabinono-1,4-lactone oxidase [Acidimicrobiales bacterium]
MGIDRQGGFRNWAGNQSCRPKVAIAARTLSDVSAAVEQATREGRRVRAIGAGHSFTGAALTDGTLLDLSAMNRVERIKPESGVAMVGAGIRLRELSAALHAAGRALPNLGDIDVQTLAGATATGTHGTGAALPNLSAGIVGFELVTATGDVMWCDGDENAEVFDVGRVSLGALGVITRIAVETVPAFSLRSVETQELVDDVMCDWDAFVASAEHAEFFWMPGTRRCLVKRNDRTDQSPTRLGTMRAAAEKLVLENVAFGTAMRVGRRFPAARPRIQKLIGAAAGSSERVDVSHRIFATPRHVRFLEMEYGVPVDAVPMAFAAVQELVAGMDDPPGFPVEVRVSAADDIPLSTGCGRDSGWIAVHRYKGLDHKPYFGAVEAIMREHGGRPHWGKLHDRSAADLAPAYARWDDFITVRDRLDPTRTFTNDYLDRVFG